MIKQVLAAAGLGFAGYILVVTAMNNKGIQSESGEGGYLDTAAGEFLKVGSILGGSLNMNISVLGLSHIKGWEKLRLVRYLDAGGKPTIGYGHLIKPGEFLDKITEAEANALLLKDLGAAIEAVNKYVNVQLTQSQFDGLVSFVFNVGVGAFRSSTLLKLLNRGDIAGVRLQFGKWVYIGNQPSAGLVNRRTADLRLFDGAKA